MKLDVQQISEAEWLNMSQIERERLSYLSLGLMVDDPNNSAKLKGIDLDNDKKGEEQDDCSL